MLKHLLIAVTAAFLTGCAVAQQEPGQQPLSKMRMIGMPMAAPAAPAPIAAPAPNPRSDIRVMGSFQPGVSTTTDAVRVLGPPSLVNNSPDGRFVYMYDFASTPQGPMMAGMLFGTNQVLIKIDYFNRK